MLKVSPRIALNVNYKQRFQTELTAIFTTEIFVLKVNPLLLTIRESVTVIKNGINGATY